MTAEFATSFFVLALSRKHVSGSSSFHLPTVEREMDYLVHYAVVLRGLAICRCHQREAGSEPLADQRQDIGCLPISITTPLTVCKQPADVYIRLRSSNNATLDNRENRCLIIECFSFTLLKRTL